MKKLVLLSLSFIFCFAFNATAQDSLIGKWVFVDVIKPVGVDSASLNRVREMFKDVTLIFKANHHYKIDLMKSDEGIWTMDGATKRVELTSNKGIVSQLEIKNANATNMLISLGKGKDMLLKKVASTPQDEVEEIIKQIPFKSATAAQLTKKWFFKSRQLPNRTPEQIELMSQLLKGSFFLFNKDQTYQNKMGKLTADGKWNFGEGNKTIILKSEGAVIWGIKDITATTLVLVKNNGDEVWTFSVTE